MKSRKNKVYLTLKLKKNKKSINIGTFEANNTNNINILIMNKDTNEVYKVIISIEEEIETKLLWHRRIGHFYHKDLTKYQYS